MYMGYHDLPVVLINPHVKFQVAIIIGILKSTFYKNLNLSLTGSHTHNYTYIRIDVRTYGITYTCTHNRNTMPPASLMVGA